MLAELICHGSRTQRSAGSVQRWGAGVHPFFYFIYFISAAVVKHPAFKTSCRQFVVASRLAAFES